MDYGLPCYKKDGHTEVAFASQKNYIALYILKADVVNANRAALRGLSVVKGCIRFARPSAVDFGVVRKLLSDTLASPESGC